MTGLSHANELLGNRLSDVLRDGVGSAEGDAGSMKFFVSLLPAFLTYGLMWLMCYLLTYAIAH